MSAQLLLHLQNVSLHFGHDWSVDPVLDDISLSIPLGQHTAILGPNGSGKTTLLKLLMRLLYPDPNTSPNTSPNISTKRRSASGDEETESKKSPVSIMGRDDWNVWELRKQLGYVNSELDHHFSYGRSGRLSIMEAVLTGYSSGELAIDCDQITQDMRVHAVEAIKKCGVDLLVERTMAQLSTGERRRVLIARALVHHPLGLVLDEPTAGLDIAARTLLLEHLHDLAAAGTTLILVTHHIEEVIPVFNRVILMKKGRIYFDGARSDAIQSERISSLFGIKVKVLENDRQHLSAVTT